MSHISDMHRLDSGKVAVGWLHPDHSFATADPSPDFLAKLKEFASRSSASAIAMGSGATGGYHSCEFCGKANGTANFGVPAGENVFFAPEMIAHYVEAHHYAPPAEFIAAIMDSPLPGTREYVDAVAPFVERQKRSWMKDPLSITLERNVAIVLFEYLSQLSHADAFWAENRADQVAIWTLVGSLKSTLVEPLDPKYQELLTQARRRVANQGEDEVTSAG